MTLRTIRPGQLLLAPAIVLAACVLTTFAQTSKPKKVFIITDMEGVSGIFDSDLQCIPYKSPRWEESHKLLTGAEQVIRLLKKA
jgi:hypothetical protein